MISTPSEAKPTSALSDRIDQQREAFRCHLAMMLAGVLDAEARAYLLATFRGDRSAATTPDWDTWWARRLQQIETEEAGPDLGPQLEAELDQWPIPVPCTVGWDTMQGDGAIRHCGDCNKSVYNLREVTRSEAASLLQVLDDKPCVHSYRRPDGTVLFAEDVPVCAPVAAITKRLMPRNPAKKRGVGLRVMAVIWVWMVMGVVTFSMVYADKIQSFFSEANSEMDGGPGFP